jgi:pimeloyl-ACP methyl ester carboxylesterase
MKIRRLMTATLVAVMMALWTTGVHAAFVDNGNGTVTDTSTGLMWQQDTARDGEGNYDPMNWEEALAYCESRTLGGHTDWRLPTIKELRSLVDYSRYNPAINTAFFPNTVSCSYWSSTTDALSTVYAWGVDFDYGGDGWDGRSYGSYVRAVRGGQSGSFGNLDHFVISVPAGTKSPGSSFSVSIQAVDASGRQVLDFSSDVSLWSDRGPVNPTSARLSGGAASVSVTVGYSGNMCLRCCGPSASGESDYFQVGSTGICGGKISGRVIDANEAGLSGAAVEVYNQAGTLKGQGTTDSKGRYAFSGLCSDTYRLLVKKGEYEDTVSGISVSGWTGTPVGDIQLQINGGAGATPVVLVPGMMGSTLPNAALPELCSSAPCKNLTLWDVGGLAGWGELKSALTSAGFKWVECPWDWRWGCDAVYKEYLKEKIDKALSLPGVTGNKVHIVAHSMGGLVVRAYVQHEEDYRQDVARVAFVGTPHQGSCNPYYIWEGGDPKVVDDITDSGWKSIVNVYTNTLRLLWLRYNLLAGPLSLLQKPTRSFVRDKVGSLNQLLETEAFLYDKDDGSVNNPWAVTSGGNINQWLKNLNEGNGDYRAPGDVMSGDGNNDTVRAKLFVGKKSGSTIQYVKTKGQTKTNDLYEDGIPTFPTRASAKKGTGDGTVPYASATWPDGDGWADLYGIQFEEDHLSLIKRYKHEIVAFLSGDLDRGQTLPAAEGGAPGAGAAASTLSVSIAGDMRLLVTDPNGLKTGIDPSTQETVEQIASATCTFSSEGGGVNIPSPGSGTYQVQYFGEQERNFVISLGYMDDETTESLTYQGFRPAAARTFSIAVNHAGTPRITVTPPAKAPTNLQANPYTSGTEKTRLTWTATGEAGLTGYNIYAVAELEPFFAKVTTVGAGVTSYDAADA